MKQPTKMLVETTGPFCLVDVKTKQTIQSSRPTVISPTQFFNQRLGYGQIRVLVVDLIDEATDEILETYIKEAGHNVEVGVASFLSSYSPTYKEYFDEVL